MVATNETGDRQGNERVPAPQRPPVQVAARRPVLAVTTDILAGYEIRQVLGAVP